MNSPQFSSTYRISPNAVHETFEDEVVVINMISGSYFSLNATGLEIWALLEQNHSLQSVVNAMQSKYEGEPDTIQLAVEKLVGELCDEDLIVALAPAPLQNSASPCVSGEERAAFVAPTIAKFTDMQELLLLDPIHEVDEAGWPFAKPEIEDDAPREIARG